MRRKRLRVLRLGTYPCTESSFREKRSERIGMGLHCNSTTQSRLCARRLHKMSLSAESTAERTLEHTFSKRDFPKEEGEKRPVLTNGRVSRASDYSTHNWRIQLSEKGMDARHEGGGGTRLIGILLSLSFKTTGALFTGEWSWGNAYYTWRERENNS